MNNKIIVIVRHFQNRYIGVVVEKLFSFDGIRESRVGTSKMLMKYRLPRTQTKINDEKSAVYYFVWWNIHRTESERGYWIIYQVESPIIFIVYTLYRNRDCLKRISGAAEQIPSTYSWTRATQLVGGVQEHRISRGLRVCVDSSAHACVAGPAGDVYPGSLLTIYLC